MDVCETWGGTLLAAVGKRRTQPKQAATPKEETGNILHFCVTGEMKLVSCEYLSLCSNGDIWYRSRVGAEAEFY
jgi:hypothetical protein